MVAAQRSRLAAPAESPQQAWLTPASWSGPRGGSDNRPRRSQRRRRAGWWGRSLHTGPRRTSRGRSPVRVRDDAARPLGPRHPEDRLASPAGVRAFRRGRGSHGRDRTLRASCRGGPRDDRRRRPAAPARPARVREVQRHRGRPHERGRRERAHLPAQPLVPLRAAPSRRAGGESPVPQPLPGRGARARFHRQPRRQRPPRPARDVLAARAVGRDGGRDRGQLRGRSRLGLAARHPVARQPRRGGQLDRGRGDTARAHALRRRGREEGQGARGGAGRAPSPARRAARRGRQALVAQATADRPGPLTGPMPVPLERAGGVAACAFFVLASVAAAQKTKSTPLPAADPYTGGDAQRLALLGYRSFGPFLFGAAASDIVQEPLGDVPIQWVETEHFRLGSALAEIKPEDPREIAELKLELGELRARLESIPASPKKLDPWLRLHLFARRLEALYADFRARLGVKGSGKGEEGAAAAALPGAERLTVLLTQKKSMLARFTQEYCGEEHGDSFLHHFTSSGSFFFGLSDESLGLGDSELHYATVYGVTQLLLMAINGFPRHLPSWWENGVALWFAREREPRLLLYARPSSEILPDEELSDWEALARGRVEAGACLGWKEMLGRASWVGQPFGDNVILGSRIDYFLRRPGGAAPLVTALHAPGRTSADDVAAALASATGLDLDALDEAWKDWVRANYRKKRR